MDNIKIQNIEIYHGEKIVDNDFFIEHYKKQGKDIGHFFKDIMGRNTRYLIDPEHENSLTMAIQAAEKVLSKSGLTGNDIDMIVLSSYFPEYASPPCSMIIHDKIKGNPKCLCYDVNMNCAGMTFSVEQIYRQMKGNKKINRALLIGSDYLNLLADKNNEVCYGQFGDVACAVILEKTTSECGLIDSEYSIAPDNVNYVRAPAKGTSNMSVCSVGEWIPYNTNTMFEDGVKNIKSILEKNHLDINDISMFCLSQFQYKYIKYLRKELEIPEERSLYIGDKYGYTGTTSPFIAFYESINQELIKRGDLILIWTVGMGGQNIALLVRY